MTKFGTVGASLSMWPDYFPSANIYGGDIDKNSLFQDWGVQMGCLNSLDRLCLLEFQKEMENPKYDIIIDAWFHNYEANTNNFEIFFSFLTENGIPI